MARGAAIALLSWVIEILVVVYWPYVTDIRLRANPFDPVLDRDHAADKSTARQLDTWVPPAFMTTPFDGKNGDVSVVSAASQGFSAKMMPGPRLAHRSCQDTDSIEYDECDCPDPRFCCDPRLRWRAIAAGPDR